MTDWNQYSVLETPEHLMIKHLSEQIRDRVDRLEWMLDRALTNWVIGCALDTKDLNGLRDQLEEEWKNHQNAKAVHSSESAKDSSPQIPSPPTPNS